MCDNKIGYCDIFARKRERKKYIPGRKRSPAL